MSANNWIVNDDGELRTYIGEECSGTNDTLVGIEAEIFEEMYGDRNVSYEEASRATLSEEELLAFVFKEALAGEMLMPVLTSDYIDHIISETQFENFYGSFEEKLNYTFEYDHIDPEAQKEEISESLYLQKEEELEK